MNSSDRYISLDALRGFAVLGILLMNIISFALPYAAYINPRAWGGDSIADVATWAVTWMFFDGKMRALFSLLFGASTLLVIDKVEMAGGNGILASRRRLFWLLLFGLAHYLLLWRGDILRFYAILGFIALLFAGQTPLTLVKWAFGLFLIFFLGLTAVAVSLYAMQASALAPGASADTLHNYRQMIDGLGAPGSVAILTELLLYRGSFGGIVLHEVRALANDMFDMLALAGLDTLGWMLLGMAMLKSGFLTGDWDLDQYRKTARHCFLIGLPPMIAMAAWVIASDFDPLRTATSSFAWSFPFRIPLTVGFAALLLWIVKQVPGHWLIVRVTAAGRMAFSNYLGTSLVMTAIFYGWGIGLFGQVSRAPLYGFVVLGWVLMLLWSKPWLDRFAYGPLEWLWRSLARGKVQAIRKSAAR
ncbi:DUF418 domain-containing protein [soil metagenome]